MDIRAHQQDLLHAVIQVYLIIIPPVTALTRLRVKGHIRLHKASNAALKALMAMPKEVVRSNIRVVVAHNNISAVALSHNSVAANLLNQEEGIHLRPGDIAAAPAVVTQVGVLAEAVTLVAAAVTQAAVVVDTAAADTDVRIYNI